MNERIKQWWQLSEIIIHVNTKENLHTMCNLVTRCGLLISCTCAVRPLVVNLNSKCHLTTNRKIHVRPGCLPCTIDDITTPTCNREEGMYCLKAWIHCTPVPETSFDLLFLEQITQLLCIGVPETFAAYGMYGE